PAIGGRYRVRRARLDAGPPAGHGQEVLATEPQTAPEKGGVEANHPGRRRLGRHPAQISTGWPCRSRAKMPMSTSIPAAIETPSTMPAIATDFRNDGLRLTRA